MTYLFAEAPALPLNRAGPFVAAAYMVFLLIILIYVSIMARRLMRNSRELRELRAQLEQRDQHGVHERLDAQISAGGGSRTEAQEAQLP